VTTLALMAVGVVMVHSAMASVSPPGAWYARLDVRHWLFAAAAAILLLLGWLADYRYLAGRRGRAPLLAGAGLCAALVCGALVFVPGAGRSVGGYHRWIRVGPSQFGIGFQPSELIKIALLVFLAAWLSRPGRQVRSFGKVFAPAVLLIGLCVGLVVTQDFGTAVIIGVSAAAALLLAGVPWTYLMSLLPLGAAGFYAFVYRSPHRWARMTAVVDVWTNKSPSAYQPRQSLLAVLTGGWFGKGPGQGTLKLGFLPEDSTDFIFSALCEEWGFVGAMVLLGLLILWIRHAWQIALESGDQFGRVLVGSLGFLIGFQAVLHIAVDTVALPPTGIALPFVSAGGTSLMLMAAATAMIVSVSARRGHRECAT